MPETNQQEKPSGVEQILKKTDKSPASSQKLSFKLQTILDSPYSRILLTFILFLLLFFTTFIIAYLSQQRKLDRESGQDIIPKSEIILPTKKDTNNPEVQGVAIELESTCLETERKMLEEIIECEEVSEEKCLEIKEDHNECLLSCQKELGETECFEVCKPVCEKTDTLDSGRVDDVI